MGKIIKDKDLYECKVCGSTNHKYFSYKLSLCNSCKCKRMRKLINYDSKISEYKRRFGGLREYIIQRDDEKCIFCGMTRAEHYEIFKRDITVDHIDKNGRYSKSKNNNSDNLQTLCLRCHSFKDAIRHGRYATYHVNFL